MVAFAAEQIRDWFNRRKIYKGKCSKERELK